MVICIYTGCRVTPLSWELDKYLTDVEFWGTILVVQEDNIIHRKAYGKADAEHNVKNKISTPFYLCSLTKQFTGAAIMVLEAEGKLDVSDTLDKYFPEYDKCKNITVSALLSMTAGTGDFLAEFTVWFYNSDLYNTIKDSITAE